MSAGHRNRWLDILRAAAIVLVVNCHVASSQSKLAGATAWYNVLGVGGHGVDLFFLLSGWLLGCILFKEVNRTGTLQVGRFLKRRWLRTLPAYYAVLSLTLAQSLLQGKFAWPELCYFAFGQAYVYEQLPLFGVSWSLCVEEHFYLLIAPLVLLIGRKPSSASYVLLTLLVAPPILRWQGIYTNPNQSHVRLDQCAAGVSLAYLYSCQPAIWAKLRTALPVLCLVAVAMLSIAVGDRLNLLDIPIPLVLYTFVAGVLVCLSEYGDWWRNRVSVPGAHYVATRSYSIYLLHVEAIATVDRLNVESFFFRCVFVWAISCLLAEGLHRLVELPGMKLRDRLVTSLASASPVQPSVNAK